MIAIISGKGENVNKRIHVCLCVDALGGKLSKSTAGKVAKSVNY